MEVMCNMSKQSRAGRKNRDMVVMERARKGGDGGGRAERRKTANP